MRTYFFVASKGEGAPDEDQRFWALCIGRFFGLILFGSITGRRKTRFAMTNASFVRTRFVGGLFGLGGVVERRNGTPFMVIRTS